MSYEELGFAKIDHHRIQRHGFPEVIYCEGKTPQQCALIAQRILARPDAQGLLGTRADRTQFEAIYEVIPDAVYHETARAITVTRAQIERGQGKSLLILAAGTSDLPVAEEAAVTLETLGYRPKRVYDVGVAGLHRLLDQIPLLTEASAIIVVAGMEGALASVVGGLVGCPVVAVPTSVGYGAAFGGLAALLGMLNACASGITVTNIDNGFGAAWALHRMLS